MFYEVFFDRFGGVAKSILNVIYNNCLWVDNIALALSMCLIVLFIRVIIPLGFLRKLSLVQILRKFLLRPLWNWVPMRLVLSKLKLRFRTFKLLNPGRRFFQNLMYFVLNLFEIAFILLVWNMLVNLFNFIGNFRIEIL